MLPVRKTYFLQKLEFPPHSQKKSFYASHILFFKGLFAKMGQYKDTRVN